MNEGDFVAHGMKIGGNLRQNYDGISYVNFREDKNKIQKSMYIPWYLSSGFYRSNFYLFCEINRYIPITSSEECRTKRESQMSECTLHMIG